MSYSRVALVTFQAYVWRVQRLFTMFPTGAAGISLLVMRVSVAATLLLLVLAAGVAPFTWWELTAVTAVTIALCLGLYSSVFMAAGAIFEIAILSTLRGNDALHLLVSVCMTLSMIVLGPGAYSVDAKLFGRRRVVFTTP